MKLNHYEFAIGLFVSLMFVGCAAGQAQLGTANDKAPPTTADAKPHPAMADPSLANKKAPDEFKVKFQTTKGDFVVKVTRAWSPNGADRFYNMVDIGYYNDIVIFRAIDGFMFQFGIHGDPAVNSKWSEANFKDDPNAGVSNKPGYLSFAKSGRPNSRSTQIFVNLGNNANLDGMNFTPFAQIVEGADVVMKINTEYGENARDVQGNFQAEGNKYILKKYPKLDIIKSVSFLTEDANKGADAKTNPPQTPGNPGQPKE
jgi:peptidyl-prolyl cis-trans isomerase A (cyclophilin A)